MSETIDSFVSELVVANQAGRAPQTGWSHRVDLHPTFSEVYVPCFRHLILRMNPPPDAGSRQRFCPICRTYAADFAPFGVVPRPNARCRTCFSAERHRFAWLYFQRYTDLFDTPPKRMLDVGPEQGLIPFFKEKLGAGYISADLEWPVADVQCDVTAIPFPNAFFDAIYCSHVLEHVADDRQALREIRRVLKPSGWALLMVPITADVTFEDPSVIDPTERLRLFGQEDHVRRYGPDFVDRVQEADFTISVFEVEDLFEPDEIERMALTWAAGSIYYCTR